MDSRDLEELQERSRLTADAARPDAVARRHERGGRTARENIDDLIDPGSLVEYGRFAIAAQRGRREIQDLIENTPADGIIGGTATVGGIPCAVISYDYTVLAGTQGHTGHRKKDRLFELIERMRLPVIFFAEGGGGRPGDTDHAVVSALDTRAFALWASLSGLVPRIAVVAGRCFAGNAVIAGCSDLIVATANSSIGMGGPAMIEGGGLGRVDPDEVGPAEVQVANGVIDVLVEDEAAAVSEAARLLGLLSRPAGSAGPIAGPEPEKQTPTDSASRPPVASADQSLLRQVIPERRRRAYDVNRVVELLADAGSMLPLRPGFAPEMVTSLIRVGGRAVGVIANNPMHFAGAITSDGADKAARFMQLCEGFRLPIVSLVDTPGMMVGPEAERTGLVRHCSRMLVAGAALTVPMVAVVLRRGYGLGAQAMVAGSLHEPLLTVAWAGAELGPMGLEGAVRLGLRKELEAIEDQDERERRVRELTELAEKNANALNAATLFEIDDVIDPADTRRVIAATIARAEGSAPRPSGPSFIDTW
jgi:acetyl-CoA carboxylase carboxyltransferase component